MNAIASTIKAAHATEEARRFEEDALKDRQRAVIESGKTRCDALIREFNETPIALQYTGTGMSQRKPCLSNIGGTSSAFSSSMLEYVQRGMRIFLCWKGNHLVATFNAEIAHPTHLRNIVGKSGNAFETQLNQNRSSKLLMSLADTEFAIANSYVSVISTRDLDIQAVGSVMDDGRYTNDVHTVSPARDRVFDLPSDFIEAVLRPMTPFLRLIETTPSKKKKS